MKISKKLFLKGYYYEIRFARLRIFNSIKILSNYSPVVISITTDIILKKIIHSNSIY